MIGFHVRAIALTSAILGLWACASHPVRPVVINEPPCKVVGASEKIGAPRSSGSLALDSDENLYVVNLDDKPGRDGPPSSGVRVYAKSAFTNAKPISRTIHGVWFYFPDPNLRAEATRTVYFARQPQSVPPLAIDARRNIYVVDYTRRAILVFDAHSSGVAIPSRIIAGTRTGLSFASDLAVRTNGELYIVDAPRLDDSKTYNSIVVFAPGQHGDTAPIRVIKGRKTSLHGPIGLALMPDGTLAVSAGGAPVWPLPYYINFYTPDVSGNTPPFREIIGAQRISNDMDHADDDAWLKQNGLEHFFGFAGQELYEPRNDPKLNWPIRMTFDARGDLWVVNIGAYRITEYSPGADGDAKPILLLEGSRTGLVEPTGIAVDAAGDVFVSSFALGTINEYCGLAQRSR
jgi:hypothetical protein